jgi:glyoxylase-like metal-dependent hydrolase (beta-lactamase superfamily II)
LAIQQAGYSTDEVTDVFLTHLHFDHCGGAIVRDPITERLIPSFKNATYWSNERHWQWATVPNAREKASFLSENILPIQESGQLKFIERASNERIATELGFDVWFVDGHTDSMMIPLIPYRGSTLAYMADLLPSVGHIPLAYVMGYDTRPLITLDEKKKFLTLAEKENWTLFLEHDSVNECCTLQMTEKGIRLGQALKKGDW